MIKTRAFGRSISIRRRQVNNNRLATVGTRLCLCHYPPIRPHQDFDGPRGTLAVGESRCHTVTPATSASLAPTYVTDVYDQHRAHGDRHAAALRKLFNRSLGQLWHCLQTRQLYDEAEAFPAADRSPSVAA
jgi:hypothetical protein